MSYENMGDLISDLRKQKNLTQKDLAGKLHVTDKAVSKWERGISCPDINTIPQIAKVLNISTEELLNFHTNDLMKTTPKNPLGEKINSIVNLVFNAVGIAMGIAVLVLSILGGIGADSAITLMALGLTCLGISQLKNK